MHLSWYCCDQELSSLADLKGSVACCHSFCLFFLHFMLSNGYTVYDEAGGQWWMMTCNGNLRGISGFQDVVMANLLGSGGLQVTVSSSIDPFPPWDSNLRPTHQRL